MSFKGKIGTWNGAYGAILPAQRDLDRRVCFSLPEDNECRGWEALRKGLTNMLDLREALMLREGQRKGRQARQSREERKKESGQTMVQDKLNVMQWGIIRV